MANKTFFTYDEQIEKLEENINLNVFAVKCTLINIYHYNYIRLKPSSPRTISFQ